MPESVRVEEVQVSELRKRYKFLLQEGKPLILRKNTSVVGVLLCLKIPRWSSLEHPRKEGRRLRTELESILKQLRS
jgi:hypothetical protein